MTPNFAARNDGSPDRVQRAQPTTELPLDWLPPLPVPRRPQVAFTEPQNRARHTELINLPPVDLDVSWRAAKVAQQQVVKAEKTTTCSALVATCCGGLVVSALGTAWGIGFYNLNTPGVTLPLGLVQLASVYALIWGLCEWPRRALTARRTEAEAMHALLDHRRR
jgi:hypothetical protein